MSSQPKGMRCAYEDDPEIQEVNLRVQELIAEARAQQAAAIAAAVAKEETEGMGKDDARANAETTGTTAPPAAEPPSKSTAVGEQSKKSSAIENTDAEEEAHLPSNEWCRAVLLDKRKGRGVVASQEIPQGTTVLAVHPTLHVFYNAFADKMCAECLRPIAAGETGVTRCRGCNTHAVCKQCLPKSNPTTHMKVCGWMRAAGIDMTLDTDYIRFILEYIARIEDGDAALLRDMCTLCTCRSVQSSDFCTFAKNFAAKIVRQFAPLGMAVAEDHIADFLLRIKVNSLGFPVHEGENAGWAVHPFVAMFNHSCNPNVDVRHDDKGQMVLTATRRIEKGEELCIHYVDPDAPLEYRTRLLLESYRFLCTCEKCVQQRAVAKMVQTPTTGGKKSTKS